MGGLLVLGWGSAIRPLIQFGADVSGEFQVVTPREETAETLLEEGVNVTRANPTDPAVLAEYAIPDVILIAGTQGQENLDAALAAREVFEGSTIIARTGESTPPEISDKIRRVADQVIDDEMTIAREVLDIATSPRAVRAHRVRSILDRIDGRLCVVMHDHPDPDALASAEALRRIAKTRGVPASVYYYGDITHQSNRAFVNLLELPVEQLAPAESIPDCEATALVDHSLPSVNDSLPPETVPDLIFDHHTPSGPIEGGYVDLREDVGATSSMMAEYLQQLEIDIDETLATALLYGIRTDTNDFTRKVSETDFDAAGILWGKADHESLRRVENPSLSRDTLGTIGDAIAQRHVQGSILSSCVGEINTPDALAQAADLLLQMEGIDVLLVYGLTDDVVHASARARPNVPGVDLADIMREAFDPIGTAGGHEEMAGAQIPVGMLGTVGGDHGEVLVEVIREVIDERFFETVEGRLGRRGQFSRK